MPYDKISELPKQVTENLPEHAEEIYIAAYNSAWDTYRDPSTRDGSREETAHRVAWSAVKQKYEKSNNGEWVEKKK